MSPKSDTITVRRFQKSIGANCERFSTVAVLYENERILYVPSGVARLMP